MDVGESLVGAYMRQVRSCHTVAFNIFLPQGQGELDVVGVANAPGGVEVWMAEVAIHLDSLNYGGYSKTVDKVSTKVAAARAYAAQVYRDVTPTVEFWSPVVPSGLASAWHSRRRLDHNDDFTARVNELAALAKGHTKTTGDDAYRFLQLLTHLRGDRPRFGPAGGQSWRGSRVAHVCDDPDRRRTLTRRRARAAHGIRSGQAVERLERLVETEGLPHPLHRLPERSMSVHRSGQGDRLPPTNRPTVGAAVSLGSRSKPIAVSQSPSSAPPPGRSCMCQCPVRVFGVVASKRSAAPGCMLTGPGWAVSRTLDTSWLVDHAAAAAV